jgi:hypothetical protein
VANQWYYSRDGKQASGPVSWRRLFEMADSGVLCPTHHVWRDGWPCWVTAGAIKELFPVLPAAEEVPASPQPGPAPTFPLERLLYLPLDALAVLFFLCFLLASYLMIATQLKLNRAQVSYRDNFTGDARRPDWAPLFQVEGQMQLDLWDAKAQQADRDKLERLFADPADQRLVVAWGRELVDSWRGPYIQRLYQIERSPGGKGHPLRAGLWQVCEAPVDDRLAAHAAWRRLTCAPGASEADLFRLQLVVEARLPDPRGRAPLLAWAGRRRLQKDVPVERPLYPAAFSYRMAPAPPDTEWFRWWILYEDWTVSDQVFVARKADLLARFGGERKFGRDTWKAVQTMGRELARERRQSDPTFPADSERAALIAVTDHLSGLDERFARVQAFDQTRSSPVMDSLRKFSYPLYMAVGLSAIYLSPSDDLLKLHLSKGWTPVEPPLLGLPDLAQVESAQNVDALTRGWFGQTFWVLVGSAVLLVLGCLVQRGMRLGTLVLPGWLLVLRRNPVYLDYRRSVEQPRGWLLTFGLVLLLTTLAEWIVVEPFYILWTPSFLLLVLCVFWSVVLGGVLVQGVANLACVILIRLGCDPQKLWLDVILPLVLGWPLLGLFGIPWHVIFFSLLIAALPQIFDRLRSRGGPRPGRTSESHAPDGLLRRRPIAVGLATAAAAFVALGCFLCAGFVSHSGTVEDVRAAAQAQQAAASRAATTLSAREFAVLAQRDVRGLDGKYRGRWLRLTATPRAGGQHPAADYCLPLETEMDGPIIECLFHNPQARHAARQRGRPLRVVGRYDGSVTDGRLLILRFGECVVEDGLPPASGAVPAAP